MTSNLHEETEILKEEINDKLETKTRHRRKVHEFVRGRQSIY